METVACEPKRRFTSPVQPVGLMIVAWFAFRLLAWLYLATMGTVTTAETARLMPGEQVEGDDKVPYFYQVDGVASPRFSGWRRGIDYGGQKLTVVYCGWLPTFHATALRQIAKPSGLWLEDTYVLRAALYGLGVLVGIGLYSLPRFWAKGGLRLMPGLDREDPMNPR